ncbi:MAG: hypothetical protein DHS20C07_00370 [Methyloligella sp.]|nr:MAG: hypothetical protein DHS20C07_00370 [Methyloligella sp.]
MKEALYIIGDLIHHLQRERGCSAMLLCSEGKLFSNRIEIQFEKTDQIFEVFADGVKRWSDNGTLKNQNLKKLKLVLNKSEELALVRENIRNQDLGVSASLNFYSHELICPLLNSCIEIALNIEDVKPAFVSALNAFLQWKERIGLERAIGVKGFTAYSFQNIEFVERLQFLLSEQNNYQNTFLAVANEKQKRIILEVLETEACQKLDHLHDDLRQSPDSASLYELTPEAWFDLISEKINALQTILNELIDTLDGEIPSIKTNTLSKETGSIAVERKELEHEKSIETVLSYSNNIFAKHALLIDSLQIFSGLSRTSLQSLFQHAQVREFNKGKLLFLEGEQANRLYIILKGWIKLFKGTSSGDEAILQMLSAGDTIMETAVYLNLKFPVSAQVSEDATILSLPAPVIREQVKQNNILAVNLLSSMCYRSQNLIRQIEIARLKTVDERIGWFLLKVALDQKNHSKYLQLPYDKTTIASYLNMKRETFSRALKRLKQKGFIIENDLIILPHEKALCEFCDHSLAENCPRHNTNDCPNPQFLSDDDIKIA